MDSADGKRLAALRTALGLTQGQLARQIRLSSSYISAIEQGQKPLNARIIKLIADTFNVNEAWLQSGAGEMFKGDEDRELQEILGLFDQLHPRLKELVIKQLEVLLDLNREAQEGGDTK
jgi:transcriptional regulator with XRE-family HTH domain